MEHKIGTHEVLKPLVISIFLVKLTETAIRHQSDWLVVRRIKVQRQLGIAGRCQSQMAVTLRSK